MRTLTRGTVIDELRDQLSPLTSERHSMCEVAGKLGIFCHGFNRLSDSELREKFSWISRMRHGITREKLEDLANRYTLARQEALEVPFTCDALTIDRDTCLGWDEFSDDDLARFYKELAGEEIAIDDAKS